MQHRLYPTDEEARYALIGENDAEKIMDLQTGTNVFFVATTGFGTRTETFNLAKSVVDFLNSNVKRYAELV